MYRSKINLKELDEDDSDSISLLRGYMGRNLLTLNLGEKRMEKEGASAEKGSTEKKVIRGIEAKTELSLLRRISCGSILL